MIQAFLTIVASLTLAWLPTTRDLSFEYHFALGIAVYFIFALLPFTSFKPLLALILPLSLILVSPFFKHPCRWDTSLYWFVLLPVVSAFFGACTAYWAKNKTTSTLLRFFFVCLPLALFSALTLFDYYQSPALFFLHPAFGYYPGPLYDEWIPILPKVITFRLWVVALSFYFIFLARKNPSYIKKWSYGLCLLIFLFFRSHLGWNYSHVAIQKALGQTLKSPSITLIYDAKTFTPQEAGHYVEHLTFHLQSICKKLNLDPRQLKPVRVYVYPDPHLKYELTGTRYTAIGHPLQRSIHILEESPYNSILIHELTHVVSHEFGPWPLRINFNEVILEGTATAVEAARGSLSVHEWSRAMLGFGLLPDIEELLGFGGFFAEAPARAYLASGSFCLWLIDTQGADLFKKFYEQGRFEKIYRAPLKAKIEDWKRFLQKIKISKKSLQTAENTLKARSLFAKKCPHDVAEDLQKIFFCQESTSDCKYKHLKMAFTRSGSDPSIGLAMARELISLSRHAEAHELLEALRQNKKLSDIQRFRIMMMRGDLEVLHKKYTQAFLIYEQAQKQHPPKEIEEILFLKMRLIEQRYFARLSQWLQKNNIASWMFQDPPFASYALSLFVDRHDKRLLNSELKKIALSLSEDATLDQSLDLAQGYELVENYRAALKFYRVALLRANTQGFRIQIQRNIDRLEALKL